MAGDTARKLARTDVMIPASIANDPVYGPVRADIIDAARGIARARGLEVTDPTCVYSAAVVLLHQAREECLLRQLQMGHAQLHRPSEADLAMFSELVSWLAARMHEQQEQLHEYDRLFELQWKRMMEAITLWRRANPGNDLVMPDLGQLLTWLLNRMRTLEEKLRGGGPMAVAS